jgi:hypothetical protein
MPAMQDIPSTEIPRSLCFLGMTDAALLSPLTAHRSPLTSYFLLLTSYSSLLTACPSARQLAE